MAIRDNKPLGVKRSGSTPQYLVPKSEGGYAPDEPRPLSSPGRVLQFRKNIKTTARCSYADIDAEKLKRAVTCATNAGAAIMLGKTQDGGAFSILILDGDDKSREYPHTIDEAHDVLDAVIITYEDDLPM